MRAQEEHLHLASGEHEHKNCCEESKHHVQRFVEEVDFAHPAHTMALCITPTITRNSSITLQIRTNWDRLISRHLTNADSGICCEAIPHQVNFLIDENVVTGKGAHSTISCVHYFFERHGLGEIIVSRGRLVRKLGELQRSMSLITIFNIT